MKKILFTLLLIFSISLLVACNKEEEEQVEHVHKITLVEEVKSTCSNEGIGKHYSCSDCKKIFSDELGKKEINLESLKIEKLSHEAETDDGDCTTAVKCKNCDIVMKEAKEHRVFDDNDCTTDDKCWYCDVVLVDGKDSHEAREDDGDCTTSINCKHCSMIAVEGKDSHEAGEDDGNCTTSINCKHCSIIAVEGKDSHEAGEDDGDCTTSINCKHCSMIAVEGKDSHEAREDDDDCTTSINCKHCSMIAIEGKDSHEAEEDDDDCTTSINCKHCSMIVVEGKDSHEASEDDGDCTTSIKCINCEIVVVEGKETHEAEEDDGNCTTEVKCIYCDIIVVEAKENHISEDDGDCTTEVKCSCCDEILIEAKETHKDENLDSMCDVCTSEIIDYLYDSEKDLSVIYSAEGLYYWKDEMYPQSNVILANDIIMPTEMIYDLNGDGINDSNWDSPTAYYNFDGNGHAIIGTVIDNPEYTNIAFFSTVMEGSKISNLFLKNITIKGDSSLGGITAFNSGLIENCGVSGLIEGNGSNIGGIVGVQNSEGKIIACYNMATVKGNGPGGIVCQIAGGQVIGCYNVGNVIGVRESGGIASDLYFGTIISCYNTGDVESPEIGAITNYSDPETTVLSSYWTHPNSLDIVGIYRNLCDGFAENVDGETITWSTAMIDMNQTLEEQNIDFRFALNEGEDKDIRPLIIVKN